MKRIQLGIAIILFGVAAVIGCLAPSEWIAAICWGSGIIGLFNAIMGYFSKDDGLPNGKRDENASKDRS